MIEGGQPLNGEKVMFKGGTLQYYNEYSYSGVGPLPVCVLQTQWLVVTMLTKLTALTEFVCVLVTWQSRITALYWYTCVNGLW